MIRTASLLLLLLGATACEKVVTLDLPEGPKQLVVEARLERIQNAVSGVQRITLSTTDPYFSNAVPTAARGATVRVTDDRGTTTSFAESAIPGVYVTQALVGEPGRRYTLQIDYANERYEATETLMAVAPIDSLYFRERTGSLGPRDGLRATIDFREPPSTANYYLWDQFVNGVRLIAPDTAVRIRVVSSDEGIAGRPVRSFQPYEGVIVSSGDVVQVRQLGLSEPMYRYFTALSDQTSNDGSPFSVPLASVRGNIVNRTRPSHRAVGYFMAAEVAEARASVR